MGVVHRVTDSHTNTECALKRLNTSVDNGRFAVEAFEREYQVLASLDHPRIIRVFDYGVDELGPYYTMELLGGRDMRTAAPLPYRTACRYLRDVAISLALLHARRLIHRDLSPGNVRITEDGHCKLLDFGALVQFGCHEEVVGTAPLIAPEVLRLASLDQRADLYSLGALAYWMISGRHAYPAKSISQLPELWLTPPQPLSIYASDIPPDLDALVLALLSADPRARPGSAAEVIARINAIGELPPEDTSEAEQLAMSFLVNPHFTGREHELEQLQSLIQNAISGHGGAVRLEALPGMGRTRLLEETAVRAKLAGAAVVRVDATMYGQFDGTMRALVLRVFDSLPELAKLHSVPFRPALNALGEDVAARLPGRTSNGVARAVDPQETFQALEGWFVQIAREEPLVLLVDNIEHADDRSLGLLASLAKLSTDHPLALVLTRQVGKEIRNGLGIEALCKGSKLIELSGLSTHEMLALTQSLFGDPPNVKRFADWLRSRTAGTPLHAVEIARQLVRKSVIRYSAGIWTLPDKRPDAALPTALADVLANRLAELSESALTLAESLSLQSERATLELCRLVSGSPDDRHVLGMLDELARNDVLHADIDGYRFSSTAIRDALLRGMDDVRLQHSHRRLGAAFAKLAQNEDTALRIQAGWHLIQGGEELRGADMIASVTHDATRVRLLLANMHHVGFALEAALEVYNAYRRSIYHRMPLYSALAQAGLYEDRAWAERYGSMALDVLEDLSGLRTARTLQRFLGTKLASICGIWLAFWRFMLLPKADRKYPFPNIFVQLFGASSTLSITAAMCFDADRVAHIAAVLEPLAWLPSRLTPVGIYQFCRSLEYIARDEQKRAYESYDLLLARFKDPRYYPTLPDDARILYIYGLHSVRGVFGAKRADGGKALEDAAALDKSGLKFHAMLASQIRYLYHTFRGESALGAPHREQVDLHAAHVGSAWQVETWEAATLILVQALLSDVVGSARAAHRLEEMSRTIPSLKRYARLATMAYAQAVSQREADILNSRDRELKAHAPRSYIGWGAAMGHMARSRNDSGQYAEAKQICEDTMRRYTDDEFEYVSHLLMLHLELARADAGLGHATEALARIDGLLARFQHCHHPLLFGLLHETRAQITWRMGDEEAYLWSLGEMERWLLPTGTPALIAKCKRIAELRNDFSRTGVIARTSAVSEHAITMTEVETRVLSGTPASEDLRTSQLVSKTRRVSGSSAE